MRRSFTLTLLLLCGLFAVVFACKKEEGTEVITVSQGAASNDVELHFKGAMAHVFGSQIGQKDRTVVLKALTAEKYHRFAIFLPATVNLKELKDALGISSNPVPSFGTVVVEPPDGYTIRLIGSDGSTTEAMSAGVLDTTGTSFVDFVPSLYGVSNKTLTKDTLDQKRIFAASPDGVDYKAFIDLEGGVFSASKYCKKTKFVDDHEKKGDREFGEFIVLKGTLTKPPILQFTDASGKVHNVGFTSPVYPLIIYFENLPSPPEPMPMSHFAMYRRLGTKPSELTWDDVVIVECDDQGPVPGCSNTRWP